MRKNVIQFTKYKTLTLSLSLLLILAGIIGMIAIGGFNLGIDFQAGLSQRVQIGEQALSVSYEGENDAALDIASGEAVLTLRGASGVETHRFDQDEYTIGALALALSEIQGVTAEVVGEADTPASSIVTGIALPLELSQTPSVLAAANSDETDYVTIDEMRDVLSSMDVAQVQVVGDVYLQEFQIRAAAAQENDKDRLEGQIRTLLNEHFGSGNVVVKGSDYVGPKFSAALSASAFLLVVVALVLILLYIWFRFKFAYAVSALTALVHDILIMLAFIAVARLEVSTTTIAAVLTIIGYSLNDTIVVFDRIRENTQVMAGSTTERIINKSITQSLSRTIMTSLTTLLAVIPLYIFATGGIKLFALNLIVGIVVGTYSSIFVASPVLMFMLRRQRIKQAEHLGKDADAVEKESLPASKDQEGPKVVEEVDIPKVDRKKRGKRKKKKS
jgi:preprotein translocase subunit SecF